jgi:PAS domain S-box-containing protein
MNWKERALDGVFALRAFLLLTAILWTGVVASSLLWEHAANRRNIVGQARIQAGIAYDKDVLYRRWNAGHGGVYVPITASTEPNPYLESLPERDLVSTSGKRLTLVNPAYMTRQVHELGRKARGVFGHLTSLRPLRPENAADPWETRALQDFARGEKEVVSVEPFEGEDHLRLMRPLVTEEACLKCHAAQGYKVGDVRGGVSVSVPLAPLEALLRGHLAVITAMHLLLWVAGLGFIGVGGRWLARADRRRHAAEEELRHDRETLRLLYESNPDAVAVIDRGYRIIYANQRVQDLAGVPLEELKGRTCHEGILGSADPCGGCRLAEVFNHGRPEGRIKHEMTPSGRENWLWQQWYPVRGAAGRVESVVEVARDITALKRAEVELQRHAEELEEANRIKGLFADIMTHDLLNPAAAASYFLEHLREGERDPERLRLFETVERNVGKLIRMIQNASSYSRLREMREIDTRVEDLGAMIREVLADLEPQLPGAGLEIVGPPEGRYPAAVNPLFANVLANLVGNAVKYAAAGRRIAIGIADAGGEWVLSVRDWGEGIPDAYKKSIFTRFERLKKEGVKGAGLGLAIASRIVELHGGRIWVEDNPEGGSVFLVTLPKAPGDR